MRMLIPIFFLLPPPSPDACVVVRMMFSDWLVRDFEPDLAARFYTAVSEARRERTAALLGRGGRRVSASGR